MAITKIGVTGAMENAGSYLSNIPGKFQSLAIAGSIDETDIVLNLAPLSERAAVTKAALEAGKHVYSQAPLAATVEEGNALMAKAQSKGLSLCAGPDTFMGAGVQGMRRLLQESVIGQPFAASANIFRSGGDWLEETTHYVTALMSFFGAVKTVSGCVSGAHRTALLRFENGTAATLTASFDAFSMGINGIEVYGSKGNMTLDDPASYGGEIKIKVGDAGAPGAESNWGGGAWVHIDSPYDIYKENSSGLGLADMAAALQTGRTPRANALQALHALEVLSAIDRSAAEGRAIEITTPFERQSALSLVAEEGVLN